jgi:hypothetical protein
MDEAALPRSMPDFIKADSAKASGKRRWVDDEDPNTDSDADSDGISM